MSMTSEGDVVNGVIVSVGDYVTVDIGYKSEALCPRMVQAPDGTLDAEGRSRRCSPGRMEGDNGFLSCKTKLKYQAWDEISRLRK